MRQRNRAGPAAALALILAPRLGQALALRTSMAELVVSERDAGRRSLELKVTNTGTESAVLSPRSERPGRSGLKDGYEPGNASWLALEEGPVPLRAGQAREEKALLRVPAGTAPGQYQVDWVQEALSESGLTLALSSKVLIEVDEPLAEVDRERRLARAEDPEFALGREEDVSEGVETGKVLESRLKIVNASGEDGTFWVRPVKGVSAERRWAEAPNPGFIGVEQRLVKVPSGRIVEVPLKLVVPREARYGGRSWTFTVAIEKLGTAEPAVRYYRWDVRTKTQEARR